MAALLSLDLYFHHNRPMIAFLGGLLFKGNLDYYFIWWRQGNAIVTQPIKKLAVAVVNALQVFPLIERSLLFYGHLLMAVQFRRQFCLPSLNSSSSSSLPLLMWPLQIICYSSNSVAFTLAMKHFSLTLIQTATLGLTVTFAFFVSLNQCFRYASGAGTVEQYHFLRRYFIHTVATFLASNRLLSKLFATFLLFNLPINAYLVNLVFTRDLQVTTRIYLAMIISYGFLCNVCYHYIFARLVEKIHRPAKPLFRLFAEAAIKRSSSRYKLPITSVSAVLSVHGKAMRRLQLAHFLAAFSTPNRYGLTYGKQGLVTFNSFVRCLAIYVKILMFSFKLLHY